MKTKLFESFQKSHLRSGNIETRNVSSLNWLIIVSCVALRKRDSHDLLLHSSMT